MLGDAVEIRRSGDPETGLLFDGGLAEDFKLATGTWVGVGPLRAKIVHFAPLGAGRGDRGRRPRRGRRADLPDSRPAAGCA